MNARFLTVLFLLFPQFAQAEQYAALGYNPLPTGPSMACALEVQVQREAGYERPVIRYRAVTVGQFVQLSVNGESIVLNPGADFVGAGLIDISDPAAIQEIAVKSGKNTHCPGSPFNAKEFIGRKTMEGVYYNLLARAPAASDVKGWMNKGTKQRKALVEALLFSRERRQIELGAYFNQFLRQDSSDLAAQLEKSTQAMQDTLAEVLGSNRYFDQAGSNAAYIEMLYRDLLGIDPPEDERKMLSQKLEAGSPRKLVAGYLISKREFRSSLIRLWWLEYLAREPTEQEMEAALSKLATGLTWEKLQAELLSSEEYARRTY